LCRSAAAAAAAPVILAGVMDVVGNPQDRLQAPGVRCRLGVQINYEAGLSTYLEVLIADEQYHQAITNDLQATAVRYQDTVALYVALGGGCWSEGDTTPPGSYSRAWRASGLP